MSPEHKELKKHLEIAALQFRYIQFSSVWMRQEVLRRLRNPSLHSRSMIYKYGFSGARYHNLGAMPFLYWKAIQEAKRNTATEFDFGRSELDNKELITFKNRWAASRPNLTY